MSNYIYIVHDKGKIFGAYTRKHAAITLAKCTQQLPLSTGITITRIREYSGEQHEMREQPDGDWA